MPHAGVGCVGRALRDDLIPSHQERLGDGQAEGLCGFHDVVDSFLSILTNGKVTTDKVGPHNDLLNEFPMSSFSASGPCDTSSARTSSTITGLALTSLSTRMRPTDARSSRRSAA